VYNLQRQVGEHSRPVKYKMKLPRDAQLAAPSKVKKQEVEAALYVHQPSAVADPRPAVVAASA
jgi:hypothetical protein